MGVPLQALPLHCLSQGAHRAITTSVSTSPCPTGSRVAVLQIKAAEQRLVLVSGFSSWERSLQMCQEGNSLLFLFPLKKHSYAHR